MYKWMNLVGVCILLILLTACSQPATPTKETSKESTSDLTLQNVFTQSLAQSEKLDSLSASIDMTQVVEIPAQKISMETSSKMDMDMIVEPLSLHQEGTTSMNMLGEETLGAPAEMKIESYLSDQGFFMFDSMSSQWLKLPKDMYEQIMSMSKNQADPSQQLKDLESFMDDFTFEQDEHSYILKLAASGDEFNTLMQKQLADTMPDMMVEEQELLENMNVEKVNFEIFIDKQTFNILTLNMVIDMTMAVEGENMRITQDIKSSYSKFNEVKSIEIPQDVINQAQEM